MEPGSTVVLKSGGPPMTVETRTADKAYCVWFDQDDHAQHRGFPVVSLKAVRDDRLR
jgi:uncharacterized protein YodC (DUF2158 family)